MEKKLNSNIKVILIITLLLIIHMMYFKVGHVNNSNDNLKNLYMNRTIPIKLISDIKNEFLEIRLRLQSVEYKLTTEANNPIILESDWQSIEHSNKIIEKRYEEYEKTVLTNDEEIIFLKTLSLYKNINELIIDIKRANNKEDVLLVLKNLINQEEEYLIELEQINIDVAEQLVIDSDNDKLRERLNLFVLLNIYSLLVIAIYVLDSIRNKEKIKFKMQLVEETITILIGVLEAHDKYTVGHSKRVALLSVEIAKEYNFDDDEEEVYLSAILHDIGKLFVSKRILEKKEKLSNIEYKLIKNHPENGYNLLIKSKKFKQIAHNVLHHHERWDGEGYPNALVGKEIPIVSRIIAIADAYDAMTTDRVYRGKMTCQAAIAEIIENSNLQFDPNIVESFILVMENRCKSKNKEIVSNKHANVYRNQSSISM